VEVTSSLPDSALETVRVCLRRLCTDVGQMWACKVAVSVTFPDMHTVKVTDISVDNLLVLSADYRHFCNSSLITDVLLLL